jgi:hypothetical protein
MNKKANSPHAWPYVIAGSLIGGAVGFLFVTETGQKIRRGITHPDEMAGNIEDARAFLANKTRRVTDQVHNVLQKAKYGLDEGERAYEFVRGATHKGQLKSGKARKRGKSRRVERRKAA